MARRARVNRKLLPTDARFQNTNVARLITKVMLSGKKSVAEKIVYSALDRVSQQTSKEAVVALEEAIKNATPLLEVKPRRVGGATYQVPVEVRPERALALALRWLVASARARKGKSMADRLAEELTDAAKGQGATVKKRDDIHKMAEGNRAFAHYKW